MRFEPSRLALFFGLSVALQSVTADAIVVARVTRRGYILVDDTGDYTDQIPTANTRETVQFIADATNALEEVDGFHEGQFLAAMQIPQGQDPLAFYLPIRNDVRGIGQRSSIDGRSEVFDTNSIFGAAFPLDGFVYLNSYRFYTDPRAVIFGRFLICTQEFGHRYGAELAVPAFPVGDRDAAVDAGDDASADAGDDASVDASDDVAADASDASNDAASDAANDATGDGGDASTGPVALARDSLLGRGNTVNGQVVNRAHWSYFFNTGGSPMEGNNWTEISPGMFRTERPTFRFSPLDLYNMGLIPPSEVPTTYLIAEPQNVPRNVSRDSAPEYYNRVVTVRGRRVDVSMEDITRANGTRSPAYPAAPRNLDVVWVLWATPEDVNDELAAEFDEAVDSCALGYAFATAERGRLVTTVPGSDGGLEKDAAVSDASVDASVRDVPFDPDVPNIPPPDGMSMPGSDVPDADVPTITTPAEVHAEGGCTCTAGAPRGATPGAIAAVGVAIAAFCRRARRRVKR